uniref:Fatty acid desaturase domain-containing protein n=1 Tax=Meloidogyne incognita TaxID=6306 RepID=A0A914MQU5_MELIC
MVLTDYFHENPASSVPFRLCIDGKWILVDEQLLRAHPGGGAMLAYRNLDATAVFHAFHADSKLAYSWLRELRAKQTTVDSLEENGVLHDLTNGEQKDENEEKTDLHENEIKRRLLNVNMGKFELNSEESEKVCQSFSRLKIQVREKGLFRGDNSYFARKFIEAIGLISFSLFLQSKEYFVFSALFMGLAWQQLGWMIHEYGHQQHFKNHWWNDCCGYVCGNFLQGFSLAGWKNQHNVHHAATNIDGRDGDLDLLPLWATVGTHLMRLKGNSLCARLIPFQHLYWAFALPLLRLSWLLQTLQFVFSMQSSFYNIYRERALIEQLTVIAHWTLVLTQYYFLPNYQVRLEYFLISQLFAGFLLSHVVTYNHYSTDKFPHNDPILSNYACLQLYTTRNMRPGLVIDWLWGGLNYQIEHHLFPTMPRHNLKKVMPLVKEFCAKNNLPYMVDDYFTGFKLTIKHLHNVADIASEFFQRKLSGG